MKWWNAGPESKGPALVFLHEGLGSVSLWRDVPEVVAKATGLRAMAYDRVGHGTAGPITKPRTVDYLRQEAYEELPRVLEECGLDDVVLIGHSDGASIALLFAARPGAVRVRGVVSEAAHLFVEDVTVEGIRKTAELYRTGDLRERLERHHGMNTDALFWAWADAWLTPEFRGFQMEADVRLVKCPVLAIQGVDDPYGTRAQLEAIERNAAGPVELLWLEECGHTPHREARERVVRAMGEFIRATILGEENSRFGHEFT